MSFISISITLFNFTIGPFRFNAKTHPRQLNARQRAIVQGKLRRFKTFVLLMWLTILVIVGGLGLNGFLHSQKGSSLETLVQNSCKNLHALPEDNDGIGVTQSPDPKTKVIEYVGISDGRFIFVQEDPTNSELKCQGALQLINKHSNAAEIFWTEAVQSVQALAPIQPGQPLLKPPKPQGGSRDAEALIYREDQYVLDTCYGSCQYITFIVGTILTGNGVDYGRNILQGAYVAQENFNRNHDKLRVRLLIANFSSQVRNLDSNGKAVEGKVVAQIIRAARADSTHIRGVIIGLPFTSDDAIKQLNQSGIPVVLSGGYSERQSITNIFPVAASIEREGQVGAWYAEQKLYKKVLLFVDSDNPYSNNLASAFEEQFTSDSTKNIIIKKEGYKTNDEKNSITAGMLDAFNTNDHPDLIYFAGDATGANIVLNALHTLKDPHNAGLQVMGGDVLYELGLNSYDPGNYDRLIFTTFAFPDEWNAKGQSPTFFTSYRLLFSGWPLDKVYGYSRPDSDAILSYDALSVFFEGCNSAYEKKQDFSSADLQVALTNIKGAEASQGVSGRISFDGYSQKAVIILYVKQGYTQPGPIYGCLDMADKNDPQCKFS